NVVANYTGLTARVESIYRDTARPCFTVQKLRNESELVVDPAPKHCDIRNITDGALAREQGPDADAQTMEQIRICACGYCNCGPGNNRHRRSTPQACFNAHVRYSFLPFVLEIRGLRERLYFRPQKWNVRRLIAAEQG